VCARAWAYLLVLDGVTNVDVRRIGHVVDGRVQIHNLHVFQRKTKLQQQQKLTHVAWLAGLVQMGVEPLHE
jgi:hypothetical protein